MNIFKSECRYYSNIYLKETTGCNSRAPQTGKECGAGVGMQLEVV